MDKSLAGNSESAARKPRKMYVNHSEMAYIMEASALSESEYLGRMYRRWPWLKDFPFTPIELIVEEVR